MQLKNHECDSNRGGDCPECQMALAFGINICSGALSSRGDSESVQNGYQSTTNSQYYRSQMQELRD